MENIKNAVNAVGDKMHEMISHSSAEHNKHIANNPDNTIGKRIDASIDYYKDKTHEASYATSKEVHKQKAIH